MLATFTGGLTNPSFGLPLCTMGFRVGSPRLWQQQAGSMHGCTLSARGAGAATAALASCTLGWHLAQAGRAPRVPRAPRAKGNGV